MSFFTEDSRMTDHRVSVCPDGDDVNIVLNGCIVAYFDSSTKKLALMEDRPKCLGLPLDGRGRIQIL